MKVKIISLLTYLCGTHEAYNAGQSILPGHHCAVRHKAAKLGDDTSE